MLKTSRIPSAEYLKQILAYDPVTGSMTWKVTRGRHARPGSPAGTPEKFGHMAVKIDSVRYKLHRLAWTMHYGVPPEGDIDHINRDPSDNRISNLRCVSRSVNLINTGLHRNNKSGCVGVHFHKASNQWTAVIKFGGVTRYIGIFKDFELAKKARRLAEEELHSSKHA